MSQRVWMATALLLLLTATAGASEREVYKSFFSGAPLPVGSAADAHVRLYGAADVDEAHENGEDWDFVVKEYDLEAYAPIHHGSGTEWVATLDFTALDVDSEVELPRHGREPFPSELYDLGFGAAVRHEFANQWQLGVHFRIGSASDKLFHSMDETTASATTFLRIPHGPHNAWILMVDARNTRNSNGGPVVPGLAYQLALGETTWAILGVPVMALHGEPIEGLALDLSWVLVRNVHAGAKYQLTEELQLSAAFDWDHHLFYRSDRPAEEDGLFLYDKRLSLGLDYALNENVRLGLLGGYSFGRLAFEGEDYDQRDKNRIDVDGTGFGQFQVRVAF